MMSKTLKETIYSTCIMYELLPSHQKEILLYYLHRKKCKVGGQKTESVISAGQKTGGCR